MIDKNNEFGLKDLFRNILKVGDVVAVAELIGRSSAALGVYEVGGFHNYTKDGNKRTKVSVRLFRGGSEYSSVERTGTKLAKIR